MSLFSKNLLICTINILLSIVASEILFTAQYGSPGGEEYEALHQGRINGIKSWGIDGQRIKINEWSADEQNKFDEYGTGANTDRQCNPFALSPNDFIIGYEIYIYHDSDDDDIRGLRFYTKNSYTYSCIADYSVSTYTNSYITNQYAFYLTGWRIKSGAIIDQIQFEFTKLTLPTPTFSPSLEITFKPTANPNVNNIPTANTTTSSILSTNTSVTSPNVDPSQFPTNGSTLIPTIMATMEPTMNPTQIKATNQPSDHLLIEITVAYLADGKVRESTIATQQTEPSDMILPGNNEIFNGVWGEFAMVIIVTILCIIWMICMILFINIIYIKYKHKKQKNKKIAETNETNETNENNLDRDIEYNIQLQIAVIDTIGGPITNNVFSDDDNILFKKLPDSELSDQELEESQETDDYDTDDGMYEPGENIGDVDLRQITPISNMESDVGNGSPFGYIDCKKIIEILNADHCVDGDITNQFVE